MYFAKVWTVSQGLQITVKWTYDAGGPLMHLMHLRTLIGSLSTLNRFSFYIWNDNRSVSKSVKKMLDHPLVTFHILLQDPMMFLRSNDPAQKISAQQNIFNFPFGNFSINTQESFQGVVDSETMKHWKSIFPQRCPCQPDMISCSVRSALLNFSIHFLFLFSSEIWNQWNAGQVCPNVVCSVDTQSAKLIRIESLGRICNQTKVGNLK